MVFSSRGSISASIRRFPIGSLRSLIEPLFPVFFPDECRLCERALTGFTPAPVCPECLSALVPLEAESFCSRCGLPFEANLPASGGHLCGLCRLAPPAFDVARSFGAYEGDLRRLIHLLKYDGMRPLAKALAAKMAPVAPRVGAVELVVPVPLHRSRRWSRESCQEAEEQNEFSHDEEPE